MNFHKPLKKTLTALLVVCLVCIMFASVIRFVPTAHATTFFSDGFELVTAPDNFDPWTGTSISSGATLEVSQEHPKSGVNSTYVVTNSSSTNAYAYKTIAGSTTLYLQAACYIDYFDLSSTNYFSFASLSDEYTQYLGIGVRNSGGTQYATLFARNITGGSGEMQMAMSNFVMLTGTFHVFEANYTVANYPNGQAHLWIDGVEATEAALTNMNTTGCTATRVRAGCGGTYFSSGKGVGFYVDDVTVADAYIGVGSPPPTVSLSVSLDEPYYGQQLQNGTQTFKYTPISQNCGELENSTLYIWNGTTGELILTQSNTTAVINNTSNSFQKNLQTDGSYKWNVRLCNATDYVFSAVNNTFSIISGQITFIDDDDLGQIRAIIVNADDNHVANWTLVAENLENYSINLVITSGLAGHKCYWSGSDYLPNLPGTYNLTEAYNQLHAHGIKMYIWLDSMLRADYSKNGIYKNVWYYNTSLSPVSEGNYSSIIPYYGMGGWLDICNPYAIAMMKGAIQEVLSRYTIDGFVLDYVRWDDNGPYGNCSTAEAIENNYDRIQFIKFNPACSDVDWPRDVMQVSWGGTGKYYTQFKQFQIDIINEYVKNITMWAKEINPNIKFGATPRYPGESPGTCLLTCGQDVGTWIKEGYVQWVAPMTYNNTNHVFTPESLKTMYETYISRRTGESHGVVKVIPCLANYYTSDEGLTLEIFAQRCKAALDAGCDGYLINEYCGSGSSVVPWTKDDGVIPDTTNTFLNLSLPQSNIFISNTKIQALSETSIQVSWTTNSLSNSTIEYNSIPLYSWSYTVDTSAYPFAWSYWKCTKVAGIVMSNSTETTNHVILIQNPVTQPIYFHIMSQSDNVTAYVYGMIETLLPSSVSLTISSPTNTTYTSSTITITMSASGGTIDTIWFNIWNGSWIYSNTTYTETTYKTLVNGTYTFYGWANNTDGYSDSESVVFTMAITGEIQELSILDFTTTYLNTTEQGTFSKGDSFLVKLTVNNTGNLEITNAFVEITITDPDSYVTYIAYVFITLEVGESTTIYCGTLILDSATSGSYSVSVLIYDGLPWDGGSGIDGGLDNTNFTVS